MKISTFDKPIIRTIGGAIEAALQHVAEEYGISLKYQGGSYQATNCTFKIEASVIGGDGKVVTREAEGFIRYCGLYNLLPEDLGKTITDHAGNQYVITGLAMKSSKFPILATRVSDGKTYKLLESTAQRSLGRKTTGIGAFGDFKGERA